MHYGGNPGESGHGSGEGKAGDIGVNKKQEGGRRAIQLPGTSKLD